jgi:hypothetical protein
MTPILTFPLTKGEGTSLSPPYQRGELERGSGKNPQDIAVQKKRRISEYGSDPVAGS